MQCYQYCLWLVSAVESGTSAFLLRVCTLNVCVILQQWGCWVRCACVRTDVAGCAGRTCGWTPCCGRPGSAVSWFSWSPQSRPLPCLPSPPSWTKSWAPREGSDGHFPPILTPATEPLTACPPDTPSQPTTGETCCVRVCKLSCDSCFYRSRQSLESSCAGEVAVHRQCPRYSLMCVAGSILQQWGRWQREQQNRTPLSSFEVVMLVASAAYSTAAQTTPVSPWPLQDELLLSFTSKWPFCSAVPLEPSGLCFNSSLSRLQTVGLKLIVKLSNVYFNAHTIC